MKGKVTSRAYEQLTPQEIRDLKLVFDVFDTDKSGLVCTSDCKGDGAREMATL